MLTFPRPLVVKSSRPDLRFGTTDSFGRIRFAAAAQARERTTIGQQEVLAHFADVAAEGASVSVEIDGGEVVEGRLGLPNLESCAVPFWVPAGVNLPQLDNRLVQLRYKAVDTPFELETSVQPRWEGLLWQLSVPNTLDANRIRLARRHDLVDWYFYYKGDGLNGADSARVIDISTTGLALMVKGDERAPRPGRTLTGTLVGPHKDRVPLRLTVRRSVPKPGRGFMLGCSFRQIGFQNMIRIANIVRILKHEELTFSMG